VLEGSSRHRAAERVGADDEQSVWRGRVSTLKVGMALASVSGRLGGCLCLARPRGCHMVLPLAGPAT